MLLFSKFECGTKWHGIFAKSTVSMNAKCSYIFLPANSMNFKTNGTICFNMSYGQPLQASPKSKALTVTQKAKQVKKKHLKDGKVGGGGKRHGNHDEGEPDHLWQGYDLKAFGIPREAYPPASAKGKHGYTVTCEATKAVSCCGVV